MPNPFLDATAFANMLGRTLTPAEVLLATPLLEVVSDWIWARKPDLTEDHPAAVVVTFEVVRDALTYGKYGRVTSVNEETSHSKRQYTFDAAVVEQFITARHREMLGLSTPASVGARGSFKRCDY